MATRVNTRFVIGLFAVLGAIVLAMVGFWFVFVQQDPAELMRRGDAMMAENQPSRALRYYGPALQQESTNLELIDKYLEAIKAAHVDDRLAAEERLTQIREWKRRAAELRPDDHPRLERFYALEHRLAEESGGGEAYNRLHELSHARLGAQPDHPVARKYRGIAQLHRLTDDMPTPARQRVRDDLQAAHEHFADDAEVLYHLARWHAMEATHAQQHGRLERVPALREAAVTISRQMLDADPEDVDRQIKHLRVLTHPMTEAGTNADASAEARALADRLITALTHDPEPTRHVLAMTELLPRVMRELIEAPSQSAAADAPAQHPVGLTRGVVAAKALLEAAATAVPDDVALLARLGRVRAITGDREGAIEAFEKTRARSESQPPIAYVRHRHHRIRSTMQLADLLLTRADQTGADEARQQAIARAAELIEQLGEEASETPALVTLRGKLALLRHEVTEAAVHLDRAIDQHETAPPSLLVLSSSAHQRLGNWGTAAERLETVLEQRPTMNSVRLELTRMLLDGGQLDEAQAHLQRLRQDHGHHPPVQQLHVRLLAKRGDVETAATHYHALAPEARGELLQPLARAYVAAGHRDQALALVEAQLEHDPADLRAVHLMIDLAPERARQRGVLAAARAHGTNEAVLRLLEQQLDQGRSAASGALMDQLIERTDDPLQQALMRVQVARQQQDEAALRAALERAIDLDTDDPRVIELRFEMAMHDEDWAEAERVARLAGGRNLDQAHGAFFEARLAAARDELAEAISHYRRGLAARRVYAEGWRRFGDVLVRRDDLPAAADAYGRAINQQPDNLAARRGLAAILDRRGERDRALEQLRAAIQHAPDDVALIEQYARYEQQHGQPRRALEARLRLAHAQPEHAANRRAVVALLLADGRHDEALQSARQLIEDLGPTRVNIGTLAATLRDLGDAPAGEAVLRDYLEQRGDDAEAADHALLARYRLGLGDGAGALAAYGEAMAREAADDQQPITAELAQLLFSRGMYAQAAALYAQVHELEPDDARTALRYGEALVRSDQLDKAEALLAELDEIGPTLALRGLLAGRRDQLDEGRALLTEAIERDGGTPSLYLERGRMHARAGDMEAAIADLEAAIAEDAELLSAYELLGELHIRQGALEPARETYARILQRTPDHHTARQRLADLHAAAGEIDEAMRLVQAAAERSPQNPTWPRQLGRLALRQGDPETAAAHFQRVAALAPTAHDVAQLVTLQLQLDEPEAVLAVLAEHPAMTEAQPALQARRGRALAMLERVDEAERAFARALEISRRPQQVMDAARQWSEALGIDAALAHLTPFEGVADAGATKADASASESEPTTSAGPDAVTRALWREIAAANLEARAGRFEAVIRRLEAWRSSAAEADADSQWLFYSLLGRAHHVDGAHAEAAAIYDQMLALRPNDLVTLNDLAYLLADSLAEPERALLLAHRAAAQAPGNARVLDTLGWAKYHAGELEAAQRALERALELEPLAEAHLHLGLVHLALGREREARRQLELAVVVAEASNNRAVRSEAMQHLEQAMR